MRRGWACGAVSAALAFTLSSAAASTASGAPRFSAHGSANQVYVTGLAPHARMSLVNRRGQQIPSIYNQTIPSHGYGYLRTRDGTKLAIDVRLPSDLPSEVGLPVPVPRPLAGGQYPTLIEYSGYGYADPPAPVNGIAVLANAMGFAVVDVNMRGTGCSGGAYDFFEPLQNLDGYDVIETVAHQPWVLHHKVGMMGISFGGISQLFTAQTRPPDLAAIAPLSVIDQTQTTLYPGGILNTGFAFTWAKERVHDALPASPSGGQSWAYQQIQQGDETCKDNQALHSEAVNLLGKIRTNNHYVPAVADPLSPITFVNKINVPVFLACQWTDEQTGGHCPDLAEHFTGTSRKWFTFTNGQHIDSLDPQTFNRWCDFLQLFVAQDLPANGCALTRAAGPLIYQTAMGIPGVSLPPDPIQQQPTYSGALAAFENLAPIRVLFDSGAGSGAAGQPSPGFEDSFSRFPVPGTFGRSWYMGSNGTLNDSRTGRGANRFTWNPRALPMKDFNGGTGLGSGGLWTALPKYQWNPNPSGTSVSYMTAPLSSNTVVIGAGYARVWVRSSSRNVDLQATVSEVRPDGNETFVQNGWVRADERKLDARKSRPLEPVLSLRAKDVQPLPRGRFTQVTVPLYYEGHAYRAGSRIK
ncbi:MAG: CocE/NonD family hydrolase, partial [Actinobacteria bacterium]